MIGQKVSHYTIIEQLGEQGMSRVYKAHDHTLDRSVAIKFLPRHLSTDDSAKEQFIREAKAASALNHPNIGVIHEIEEAGDGQIFIVMAYYEAETLRDRLQRASVSFNEATDIALQIASGLAKAHEKGIVHSDINPSNILVTTDGAAVIIDFGLARLAGKVENPDAVTTTGTVAYMAPEQALGEPVDHQTDIWSLGVILYEMTTGRLPFEGEYEQAIIYAILNKDLESVSALNEQIPLYIEKAISKALEKKKDKRYERIEDMINDLKSLSAPGISLPKHEKSIVVLPFDDISPDADNEYFSNGLTEEIITDLSNVQSLRVISRTSAMRLKGTNMDSRTIGQELNVQYILEGSVRKAGDNIRITAQLIDTETDDHVWAEKYDGDLQDVFDIQERVSRSIVDAMKVKLTPEEERRIAERPLEDINAYQCYLMARQNVMHFTEEGLNRALKSLQRGLDIVGENVLLLGGIGYVYWSYLNNGIISPDEYLPKVEEYAGRVFKLEPDSPQGHLLLGVVNMTKGHTREAVRHLSQTLSTNPNDPDALFWLVIIYGNLGRTATALQLAERLVQVDPLTPINHATPGFALLADGQFELALEREKKWYELEPDSAIAHFWYAWVLVQVDRIDEACSLFELGAQIDPGNLWSKLGMCIKHALRGESEPLNKLWDELTPIARWDSHYSWFLAESYALTGNKEKSLDWLENASKRGFINFPFISEHDRLFENIRGEERFEKLMGRIRDEWEHFNA